MCNSWAASTLWSSSAVFIIPVNSQTGSDVRKLLQFTSFVDEYTCTVLNIFIVIQVQGLPLCVGGGGVFLFLLARGV